MSLKVAGIITGVATAVTAAATAVTVKVALSRRPAMPDNPELYVKPVPSDDADSHPNELRAM